MVIESVLTARAISLAGNRGAEGAVVGPPAGVAETDGVAVVRGAAGDALGPGAAAVLPTSRAQIMRRPICTNTMPDYPVVPAMPAGNLLRADFPESMSST